ncbi:MAG: YXWGXW repeat-containing protein [Candidatus Rokubacteria bacterium]|nr:YXWGXW repeat-containing protein [Candidatus Rokubacteria bacterium]
MKTIAALALALAGTFAAAAPAAWAAHGGGHAASEPSVFPRPVDPWRHWPPRHHGHFHHQAAPPAVIIVVPGAKTIGSAPHDAVWVSGHWAWNGFGWVWVPGHWAR